MAYVDNRQTPNRLPTITAVALIHVGVVYALITGLAVDVMVGVKSTLKGEFIEEPDVEVPLPPPPPKTDDPIIEPPVAPKPRIDVTKSADFTVVDLPDIHQPRTSVLPNLPLPSPQPTAEPAPRFTPKAATPRGAASEWVTTDDYPSRALRRDQEGTTGFRLTIDARGRVSDCTVVASSGVPELDAATCKYLSRRARFEPATGADGQPTTGVYASRIVWRIPD